MTGFFSVKNFELYQHYKDRDPPWIKLHYAILNDYEFAQLPDASKAHLLAIGLLASRSKNKVPFDSEWVGKRINATCVVDLEAFVVAGWLIPDAFASNALAPRKHLALVETEAETQEQTETDKKPSLRSVKKARTQIGEFSPARGQAESYWSTQNRLDLCRESAEIAQHFIDHHKARGSVMADWPAAWRTWYRNAPKMNRKPDGRSRPDGSRRTAHDAHFEGMQLLRDEIAARRSVSG